MPVSIYIPTKSAQRIPLSLEWGLALGSSVHKTKGVIHPGTFMFSDPVLTEESWIWTAGPNTLSISTLMFHSLGSNPSSCIFYLILVQVLSIMAKASLSSSDTRLIKSGGMRNKRHYENKALSTVPGTQYVLNKCNLLLAEQNLSSRDIFSRVSQVIRKRSQCWFPFPNSP